MNDKPMSFNEFREKRVCKGGQIREDYEDYLKEYYEESREEEYD